jgi:ATP-dependent protease ClpP protease subunit
MALFDVLQELRGKGHHITTGTYGWAASMAGILLQAGDLRYCGTESYILIHEVSSFAMGKIGEIEDEVTFLNMMTARVINIFVKRSGGKLKESVLKKNWNRKDWYVDSTQALELGIVDEVR